jgi:hypothetical protein
VLHKTSNFTPNLQFSFHFSKYFGVKRYILYQHEGKNIEFCRIYEILPACGIVIPVIVAQDTQRRKVRKRALMINFGVMYKENG